MEIDFKQGSVTITFVITLRWLAIFWRMVWGRGVTLDVTRPIMKFLERKGDRRWPSHVPGSDALLGDDWLVWRSGGQMTGLSPRFLASTARWVAVPFTKLRNYGENQLRSFWVCSVHKEVSNILVAMWVLNSGESSGLEIRIWASSACLKPWMGFLRRSKNKNVPWTKLEEMQYLYIRYDS